MSFLLNAYVVNPGPGDTLPSMGGSGFEFLGRSMPVSGKLGNVAPGAIGNVSTFPMSTPVAVPCPTKNIRPSGDQPAGQVAAQIRRGGPPSKGMATDSTDVFPSIADTRAMVQSPPGDTYPLFSIGSLDIRSRPEPSSLMRPR